MQGGVYIVRHGFREDWVQPKWGRWQNERPKDPPLSNEGQRQASEAGQALVDKNIARIFASPFYRTLQTATIIAEHINNDRAKKGLELVKICVEPLLGEWMPKVPDRDPKYYQIYRTMSVNEAVQHFPLIDTTYQPIPDTFQILHVASSAPSSPSSSSPRSSWSPLLGSAPATPPTQLNLEGADSDRENDNENAENNSDDDDLLASRSSEDSYDRNQTLPTWVQFKDAKSSLKKNHSIPSIASVSASTITATPSSVSGPEDSLTGSAEVHKFDPLLPESEDEIHWRAKYLAQYMTRHVCTQPDENVLLVSHGATKIALVRGFLAVAKDGLGPAEDESTILEHSGRELLNLSLNNNSNNLHHNLTNNNSDSSSDRLALLQAHHSSSDEEADYDESSSGSRPTSPRNFPIRSGLCSLSQLVRSPCSSRSTSPTHSRASSVDLSGSDSLGDSSSWMLQLNGDCSHLSGGELNVWSFPSEASSS